MKTNTITHGGCLTLPLSWLCVGAACALWLVAPSARAAVPEIALSAPSEGDVVTVGTNLTLEATVTKNGTAISRVDFYANGVLRGGGQPDVHGPWLYSDGSFLAVMIDMMDLQSSSGEFFAMDGAYTTPLNFNGTFTTWPSSGGTITGAVSVALSFTAEGYLNAAIQGDAPLGARTLSAGASQRDPASYVFTWNSVSAGAYALTAVAVYGGSSVTSVPVNITVQGNQSMGLTIARLSGELQLSWPKNTNGWTLEWATSFPAMSGGWTPISPPYASNATSFLYTEQPGAATRFFRLRK